MKNLQHLLPFIDTLLLANLALLTYLTIFYYFKTIVALTLDKRADSDMKEAYELPFVTVAIPSYNEGKKVLEAVEHALSLDYPFFEVFLVDDSDEEASIRAIEELRLKYGNNTRLRIIHRSNREGFKGGALNEVLRHVDPRSKVLVVFDVDFCYQKDFLKKAVLELPKQNADAVQGYQCHVANNASLATWYTSAIIAADYRIWLHASELLNGFKWITGSAFAVNISSLCKIGLFSGTLTEDVDISCRLVLGGFKISYRDNLVAFGKPPTSLIELIKQQMRWIEGTSRDLKRYLLKLLLSKKTKVFEKADVLAYFLQYSSHLWITTFIMLLLVHSLLAELSIGLITSLLVFAFAPIFRVFGGLVKDYGASKKCIIGTLAYAVVACLMTPLGAYSTLRGFLAKKWHWYRTGK